VVAVPVTALAGDNGGTARANLHPANQSGVNASINFVAVDSASSVALNATATGLEESFGRYISLVYDNGSVPGGPDQSPGGPLTGLCEPTDDSIDGLMFVGIWDVDEAGNGTLLQVGGPFAPLGSYGTVSIRDTTVNGGFGTAAIVACGRVAVHPGG
jgi:hypothetical protein